MHEQLNEPQITHTEGAVVGGCFNQIFLRKLLIIFTFLLHKKEHHSMLIQKIINSIKIKVLRPY